MAKKKVVLDGLEPVVKKAASKPKRQKYNNIKCIYNGIKFDSEWERDCWIELERLQSIGAIRDLQRQVRFDLHSPYVDDDNKFNIEPVCYYLSDFCFYLPDGTYVISDSKSIRTYKDPIFRLKAKMVAVEYRSPIKIFMKGEPINLDLPPTKKKRKKKK